MRTQTIGGDKIGLTTASLSSALVSQLEELPQTKDQLHKDLLVLPPATYGTPRPLLFYVNVLGLQR